MGQLEIDNFVFAFHWFYSECDKEHLEELLRKWEAKTMN